MGLTDVKSKGFTHSAEVMSHHNVHYIASPPSELEGNQNNIDVVNTIKYVSKH